MSLTLLLCLIIVRYMKFRGGVDDNNDSVGGYYMNNVIFDHCSISFGGDEAISIIVDTPAETGGNITIQNCLMAESSTGGIFGGDEAPSNVTDISFVQNVWYNISHRFPNLNSDARYDIINNYVHNHSKRMIRGNFGYQLNEINNLYDFGNNRVWDETLNHHGCNPNVNLPLIYATGNTIIGNESQVAGETVTSTIAQMNTDNTLMWRYFYDNNTDCDNGLHNRGDQLEALFFTNTQFSLLGNAPTILQASQLKANIVSNSGAHKSLNADGTTTIDNDVLDADWKSQILQGNYIPELSKSNYNVPAISSITRPVGFYNTSKSDFIPEVWFDANVPNGSNHNTISPNGYTYLENYHNSVDEPIQNIPVTAISINPSATSLKVGETIQLGYTITPSGATDQNAVWSRSNTVKASISQTGLLTGLEVGAVSITVTSNDGDFTDTRVFNVTEGSSTPLSDYLSAKIKRYIISN